jgi:hypothetical protein
VRLLWHRLTGEWINCYTLIFVPAPKFVMCTCWQNISYILKVALLNCLKGRGNFLATSNKTYLPDSFAVLYAACVFLVFLTQEASANLRIPLPLYKPVWGLWRKKSFLSPVENWTDISVSFFPKPIHITTEKSE